MKHKVILMKMLSTISKLNLNSTMKKEVKTTLQSIMTMMMNMMAPFKDQLKCHILECINPFNEIILLVTYWGASDKG